MLALLDTLGPFALLVVLAVVAIVGEMALKYQPPQYRDKNKDDQNNG